MVHISKRTTPEGLLEMLAQLPEGSLRDPEVMTRISNLLRFRNNIVYHIEYGESHELYIIELADSRYVGVRLTKTGHLMEITDNPPLFIHKSLLEFINVYQSKEDTSEPFHKITHINKIGYDIEYPEFSTST